MKHLFILAITFSVIACSQNQEQSLTFEYPPEWEPHEAVWVDINDSWFNPQAKINARLEIVSALQPFVKVKILTNSDSLAERLITSLIEKSIDTSNIELITHPLPNNYMRDTGPIFLSNGSTLKMANWNWQCINKWCDEVSNQRGKIDDNLALRYHYPVDSSHINYEGGAIDINSNTAISIKDYALEQNQGNYRLEEIEREILRLYGKERVIWLEGIPLIERNGLKTANYLGQGADGHIDALVRFVNDSTLLVTTISESEKDNSPIQKHDYSIFKGYLDQLKNTRQLNGRPFRLIEIPAPDVSLHTYPVQAQYIQDYLQQYDLLDQFEKTDTIQLVPIIGYANFLISNNVVLVAQYWEEGLPEIEKAKDQEMKDILQNVFPDHKIIGIAAKTINWDGGGIHCSTQQEPRLN